MLSTCDLYLILHSLFLIHPEAARNILYDLYRDYL